MIQDRSKVWIGVEYFVNENDECWMMSDKNFIAMAVSEMEHIGMIDRADLFGCRRYSSPQSISCLFRHV